jgi:hypothetical protein
LFSSDKIYCIKSSTSLQAFFEKVFLLRMPAPLEQLNPQSFLSEARFAQFSDIRYIIRFFRRLQIFFKFIFDPFFSTNAVDTRRSGRTKTNSRSPTAY